MSQTANDIERVCVDLAILLKEKNAAYGDSALSPVRVFSSADACEQLRVRIDDKLSRIQHGKAMGEDTLTDLIGYLILLKIATERAKAAPKSTDGGIYQP